MAKVVTMGEIMLRLSPPGYQRFAQASEFEINYFKKIRRRLPLYCTGREKAWNLLSGKRGLGASFERCL